MVWFRWACTASCGWNVRCVGVRGDAWSVMLSPCNTVVESLPAAAIDMHEPNEVLFALDVTSAVNMNIEFMHPRIVVTVPPEKSARRRNGRTWYHIINHSNDKYTTDTGTLDDFIAKPAELKSLVNKAGQGKAALYVVKIKPSFESMCSSAASSRNTGYLSKQQLPAP